MYEYLKGIITKITAKYIVLEANGIGYILHVANPYAYSGRVNQETQIYVHQVVREDAHLLYGFRSERGRIDPLINRMKNLFIILFIFSILSAIAQKKKTYFDKATTVEVTSGSDSIQAMLDDYERIQLPPLSVFLESVYDHPSIKIYEAKKDEANAEMKVTKREWLDYFRV